MWEDCTVLEVEGDLYMPLLTNINAHHPAAQPREQHADATWQHDDVLIGPPVLMLITRASCLYQPFSCIFYKFFLP